VNFLDVLDAEARRAPSARLHAFPLPAACAGPSTGTALWAAFHLAAKMRREHRRGAIATLICDDGALYKNTYYNDSWLATKALNPAPYQAVYPHYLKTAELRTPE
jgi:cysteine synthase A